ncbi:uncharacterized protein LOC132612132 [Lycium barbarum]|uniref:uncharacterized protein LOC132612132 n=1 Tax=Lycium barbarum TaxID=112863 RepID=UPI00293F239C|nr:uncharacterized protein LOC132612132 [Lycium barbarum]
MTNPYRWTIVRRFLKSRPQIDTIRSKFDEKFAMKGTVKIGVFDNFNIFLTFNNEADFNGILYKRVIEIEGFQIWLQKWTPNFKPEEDLPIVPVWVLLPGFPFHMHTWNYTKQIVAAVGMPIEIDMATKTMNRPSMAKIRVEIDLMKPLIHNIWIGTEDDNEPLKGYTQKIEYENIPKYCKHYKKLGHNLMECRVLERKKENEKKKVEMMKQHTNPKKDVPKTDGKENVPNGKYEVQSRGRDQRPLPDLFRNRPRGRSEPPKVFKPTCAVFGIDKPMPISGKKQNEKNAENDKNVDHKLVEMEQKNQDDSNHEETNEQPGQNKESLHKEIESQGIPKEKVDNLDNTGKDQQEDQPMRQTVMINNPNELTVDLLEGKWQEFGSKKSKAD